MIIISVLQTMFDYELELVSGGTYLLCLLISLSLPWSCCLFVCLFVCFCGTILPALAALTASSIAYYLEKRF